MTKRKRHNSRTYNGKVNGVMKEWKRGKMKEAYGEMERMITPLGGWGNSKISEGRAAT